MMMRTRFLIMGGLLMALQACGGGAQLNAKGELTESRRDGRKAATGGHVDKAAAANFDQALQAFLEHDKKQDWSEQSCTSVSKMFEDADSAQKSATNKVFAEALYNAGLALQRCGKDEARAKFEAAAHADSSFHRAKAQVALYDYQKSQDLDGTISKLDQIIHDAKFQNAEALVSLAALQMDRDSDQADDDGKDDLQRAQKNLQRALAVDDTYMPAFNQLAVYYLEQAKKKAGQKEKSRRGKRGMVVSGAKRAEVNEQQLDLAALVAGQAQKKNPNYAPIYNTSGLIQVELKNFNGAVKSFARARQLDPKFFEAQMNYAAVNLSFRGYEEAEKAYREALKLRPTEYEANLGLALALRGQINDSNFEKSVNEAQKYLDEAKKIDAQRPEAYYNEAILTHEFRTKRAGETTKVIPTLEKAAGQFRDFVQKAGDDPVFAAAVKRSNERVQDIQDTIKFLQDSEEARKQEEIAAKEAKETAAREAKEKEAADKAAKEAAAKEAADKAAADKAAAADKGKAPAGGAAPADAKGAPADKGKPAPKK